MKKIKEVFKNNPYQSILFLALLVRIIATVFAKGYGMHDDHFCVLEPAQSWVDGTDYNNWLPKNTTIPQGHSFFYVGIHYFLLYFLKLIGLTDPQVKMTVIRLLHALFSIVIVALGYKITEKISGKGNAIKVGLALALLWFFPWLSVRNLVEVVAIPFLFWGIWTIYKAEDSKHKYWLYLLAGIITGFAFSMRFQTSIFIGGIGLALLILKRWKEAIVFGVGSLICIVAVQGIPDLIIWKRPFAEMIEYVQYNIIHRYEYGNNNYTMYFEVILGFLIPPISFMWFFGFLRTWKKHLIIFLPTVLFLAFHTYFPNKQERFIFTIVPFVVMLGIIGWEEFVEKKSELFKRRNGRIMKFFWILNMLLILFMSTIYSKRSRVEAMYALYPHRDSINSIVLDDSNSGCALMLPIFYVGKWVPLYRLEKNQLPEDSLRKDYKENRAYFRRVYSYEFFKDMPQKEKPAYIIFANDLNLNERLARAKRCFPNLKYETTAVSSYIDRFVQKMNPRNTTEEYYIYKIQN